MMRCGSQCRIGIVGPCDGEMVEVDVERWEES